MIFLLGLAVIMLIIALSHFKDAETAFGKVTGGFVGLALIIVIVVFTNELNRDYLRDHVSVPKVILTLGE